MFDLVDTLGQLKAQIADLKKQESMIKTALIDGGQFEYEGALFRATVSDSVRKVVDWKTVALRLNPSRQLLAANTTSKTITTVRCTARVAA